MRFTVPTLRFTAACFALAAAVALPAAEAESTAHVMRRVFDWQVAHPWSNQQSLEHRWGYRGWVQGAFLTGVMEASRATKDPAYLAYAQARAKANGWQLGARPEHADDHIVGQTYLELHALAPAPGQIEPTRAVIDGIISEKHTGREFWSWCDALYMSPPTFAKLARETGDKKYLAVLDAYYWDTNEAFYDPAEKLYYRDKRYVFPKEGPKIFWSRGNGWVVAGLARLLDALPGTHPTRPRYVKLFQDMCERLAELQPKDALWRSNLLHPEDQHGEASGSAFFCYAFAWGLNHGHLPAAKFRPVVDRTWAALLTCVDAEGRFGWVQPIGFAPGAYDATTSQEYGAGAFLAAGSQVLQLH